MTHVLVVGYLGAVVLANLGVASYGPWALPITALVLIPLDLSTRDILHERWHHDRLWLRLGLLIGTGGVLTIVLNLHAWRVALASVAGFTLGAIVDTVSCHLLWDRGRWVRMNGSNLCSAITDSVVFPAVAFGLVSPLLSVTQAAAKFFGGMAWAWLLLYWLEQRVHTELPQIARAD